MSDTAGFIRDDGKPEGYVFGRPTKYRPEFCEKVVEWGKLGKSRAWIASELDVAKATLQNWEAEHPDFLAAMTRAMTHSQRWWEDKGQGGVDIREFNGPVWSRSMGARFPEDWREATRNEHTGKNGGPMEFSGLLGRMTSNVCPKDDAGDGQ